MRQQRVRSLLLRILAFAPIIIAMATINYTRTPLGSSRDKRSRLALRAPCTLGKTS